MVYRILVFCIFGAALVGIIAFARGYRFDIPNTGIESNGLVSVSSSPRSAKVYVNDTLKGITDINLYLKPGEYKIKILKDGYFLWQKMLKVQGEIVQSVDAIIYPINSSLSPLTNIGIVKALPFGTGEKKVLIFSSKSIPSGELLSPTPETVTTPEQGTKSGLYVYDSRNHAVSIFPSLSFVLDYKALPLEFLPENTAILFSPKFDQALLFIEPTYPSDKASSLLSQFDGNYPIPESFVAAYLISLESLNPSPLEVTASVESLLDAWTQQKNLETRAILGSYKKELRDFLLNNVKLVDISVDKNKILYEATAEATLKPVFKEPLIGSNQTSEVRNTQKGALYLYDLKEDKNYPILEPGELARQHAYPMLHPNSKNIIINDEKSVSVVDYDGLNKQKVYSGPFESGFYLVTGDGKVLVLTNLNPALNAYPDLYAIGLR